MNEMMVKTQETEKQGWMIRLITAVGHKRFNWFCQCEMGLSPLEMRKFMFHSGFGWDGAMM